MILEYRRSFSRCLNFESARESIFLNNAWCYSSLGCVFTQLSEATKLPQVLQEMMVAVVLMIVMVTNSCFIAISSQSILSPFFTVLYLGQLMSCSCQSYFSIIEFLVPAIIELRFKKSGDRK